METLHLSCLSSKHSIIYINIYIYKLCNWSALFLLMCGFEITHEVKWYQIIQFYSKLNVYFHIFLPGFHHGLYIWKPSNRGRRSQRAVRSECTDIAASRNILICGGAHSFGLLRRESFCKHRRWERERERENILIGSRKADLPIPPVKNKTGRHFTTEHKLRLNHSKTSAVKRHAVLGPASLGKYCSQSSPFPPKPTKSHLWEYPVFIFWEEIWERERERTPEDWRRVSFTLGAGGWWEVWWGVMMVVDQASWNQAVSPLTEWNCLRSWTFHIPVLKWNLRCA